MVEVYHLSGKYYQKLGEAWDHEVKDFKVLYKPLYDCNSKQGSFEAHYLAVSPFERWSKKFEKITDDDITNLSLAVREYLVQSPAVGELAAGCRSFPLTTTLLPEGMERCRASVSVESDRELSKCSTESGYGARSHYPYHTINFAAMFVDMILDGRKSATTRFVTPTAVGAEPVLNNLVQSFISSSTPDDIVVRATTTDASSGITTVFAELRLRGMEVKKFGDLSLELARLEQFDTVEEFKSCLLKFYPSLTSDDNVTTFYFTVR